MSDYQATLTQGNRMADLSDDQLGRIEAHARGGLPPGDGEHYVGLLVAEVRGLRAEVEDWRVQMRRHAELQAERENLRAALALKNSYDRVLEGMTGDYLEAEARCSELEEERDRLRDGIRALHVPRDEEIERFHGPYPQDGDLEGDCPDADPLGCVGHIETIQVCAECGHDNDGDSALFRPWPCPTVALLDDQEDGRG